ncbi:uncharacterized protein F5891DRAFT_1204322 [Suillus fuscotomentosus]|uniref:Uncharacterized protein n=1 Tax=Suillus fuscotomentosus TaxID=1912939 RepID=A0AAD4HAK5_9AGAM|nr:uncharacterized protein F5891DRAFT_1204322 [Suillus fuscotomentosus]KAG1879957.1 hypothetical protein F5891DRAFT_1204322 [Suillus fuscotomentosus]
MAGTVLSDSYEPRLVRPARKIKPSTALLEHSEKVALPSQIKAINAFRAAEAAKHASNNTQLPSSPPTPEVTVSAPILANKRAQTEDIKEGYESSGEERENDEDDEECENARTNPSKRARHQQTTVEDHEDVDEDGILMDIDVQPITDESGPTCEDRTRDIDEFFGKPFERTNTNGIVKKHCKCKVCPYIVSS